MPSFALEIREKQAGKLKFSAFGVDKNEGTDTIQVNQG
jgi:hypothetical protein